MFRRRQKKNVSRSTNYKRQHIAKLFANEFRAILLTVFILVSALTMQKTLEEAIDIHVKSKLNSSSKRIRWMLMFSVILILVVIAIVLIWQPIAIEPASVESERAKPTV